MTNRIYPAMYIFTLSVRIRLIDCTMLCSSILETASYPTCEDRVFVAAISGGRRRARAKIPWGRLRNPGFTNDLVISGVL